MKSLHRVDSLLRLMLALSGFSGSLTDAAQPAVLPPGPEAASPIELHMALSHDHYSQTAPDNLLLKVDYTAKGAPPNSRPPLNLALVLDRSSSMAEDRKFPYVIEAVRAVVENLSENDIVSLVVYNERVLVLSPAGRVVNKAFLLHRLEEISPEGTTNLGAGLLEGIAQIKSRNAEGQIQQVLLLTDGQANQGVVDQKSLCAIAEKARAKGIHLSTLGCGASFNEKLLAALAGAGGGRYTYVQSAEQIPGAFAEELHGLLAVVADNARLETVVNHGGAIRRVFGRSGEPAGPSHQIDLGTLRAGERGGLLLALQPTDFQPGAVLEVTARLTFDDPQAGERIIRLASVQAAFTAEGPGRNVEMNQEVVLYGEIFDALEKAAIALEGFDQPLFDEAHAKFNEWGERARQYALTNRNQEFLNQTFLLKHFMEELAAAQAEGKLHDHRGKRNELQKGSDYQRYLLTHHRERP